MNSTCVRIVSALLSCSFVFMSFVSCKTPDKKTALVDEEWIKNGIEYVHGMGFKSSAEAMDSIPEKYRWKDRELENYVRYCLADYDGEVENYKLERLCAISIHWSVKDLSENKTDFIIDNGDGTVDYNERDHFDISFGYGCNISDYVEYEFDSDIVDYLERPYENGGFGFYLLPYCGGIGSLDELRLLPNLSGIELIDCFSEDGTDFSSIGFSDKLRHLCLKGIGKETDTSFIANCKKLESLTVWGTDEDEWAERPSIKGEPILAMKDLKSLRLRNVNLVLDGLYDGDVKLFSRVDTYFLNVSVFTNRVNATFYW